MVNINRDSCDTPGSTGDGLQAVILESTDPFGDPCVDSDLFNEVSDCVSGEFELELTLEDASQSRTYWIQVDALLNDLGLPSQCGFSINISGGPVEIFAGPDKWILKGDTVTLGAAGPDIGTFFWNNTSSLDDESSINPIANPSVTTSYTLTGDIGDCLNLTDVVKITVKEGVSPKNVIIPTSSSGVKTWVIGRIEEFPNAIVEVYNRWGQRVFVSVGYDNNNGWNGTRGGNELPEGTYYYVIQLNQSNLEVENVQTGFVAIVR